MIALDLFCGAGGASKGIKDAGFTDVIGVDISPGLNYPYEYFCEDADLVEITRHYLQKSGKPYIIENVVGAPLLNPVMLCGTMFPGQLKVFRHRLFESNIPLIVEMECKHEGHEAKKRRSDNGDFFTVAGHWVGTTAEWSDAMGIDWMTKSELAQAIPPVYSEYLAKQVIEYYETYDNNLSEQRIISNY